MSPTSCQLLYPASSCTKVTPFGAVVNHQTNPVQPAYGPTGLHQEPVENPTGS